MPEVTVFDVYRATRALEGHLADGDALRVVACDDISKDYWVLTTLELVLLSDGAITRRIPLERLRGEVLPAASGVDVRVRDGDDPSVSIAAFRRPNKFTDALTETLHSNGG